MVKKDDTLSLSRLEALREEIASLKGDKAEHEKKATPANVMKTMEELSETLTEFMGAFTEATEEMKLEEKEEDFFEKELKPLHDKLDMVLEQNEKIAKGIIAVANMLNTDIPFIKRMVAGAASSSPAPVMPSRTFESPSFESPRQNFGTMPPPVPSRPKMSEPEPTLSGAPMPPPPRPSTDKKSRFSSLFK